MHYKVFIDTNIYDGANYSFQNAAFSAIRSRVKNKELELHINSVVEGEVKKHIVRDVKKASKELLGAVKNPKLAVIIPLRRSRLSGKTETICPDRRKPLNLLLCEAKPHVCYCA